MLGRQFGDRGKIGDARHFGSVRSIATKPYCERRANVSLQKRAPVSGVVRDQLFDYGLDAAELHRQLLDRDFVGIPGGPKAQIPPRDDGHPPGTLPLARAARKSAVLREEIEQNGRSVTVDAESIANVRSQLCGRLAI